MAVDNIFSSELNVLKCALVRSMIHKLVYKFSLKNIVKKKHIIIYFKRDYWDLKH